MELQRRRFVNTRPIPPAISNHLEFGHGLGDCVQFAHALTMWQARGHDMTITCHEDKKPLFRAAGVEISDEPGRHHGYFHPPDSILNMTDDWQGNKIGWNLTQKPLPPIGEVPALWEELLNVNLTLADQVKDEERDAVNAFVDELPGPLVVLHTQGNNNQGSKNFPTALEGETYRALLRHTDATILLLDWDNRVPRVANYRLRHLTDDFRHLNLPELWCLLERASLFIGVDSGPLHFTRCCSCPVLGVWFNHHPHQFALPSPRACHLVDGRHGERNGKKRHSFNLLEVDRITGEAIAEAACRLLCDSDAREAVLSWTMGKLDQERDGHYREREGTFRACFDVLRQKATPVIVETGCVRVPDDWTAGYSTYLFGMFLRAHGGGSLDSVDYTQENVAFARDRCSPFGSRVRVHCEDSLTFLKKWKGPVSLGYLDSLDTDQPRHAEHCLEEAKLLVPHMEADGIILIDDTPYSRGGFGGKGKLAVPWLVSQGWKIHPASGYQVLLSR